MLRLARCDRVALTSELTKSYTKNLYERLRDPAYAAEYINAALAEGDEAVLMTAILRALGLKLRVEQGEAA